jgi:hypothetical protein
MIIVLLICTPYLYKFQFTGTDTSRAPFGVSAMQCTTTGEDDGLHSSVPGVFWSRLLLTTPSYTRRLLKHPQFYLELLCTQMFNPIDGTGLDFTNNRGFSDKRLR